MINKLRWFHSVLIRSDEQLKNQLLVDEDSLDFRSVRRFHANSWMKYYKQCKELDLVPIPNPLQHSGTRTMKNHYVDKVIKKSLLQVRKNLIANNEYPEQEMALDIEYDPSITTQERNIAAAQKKYETQ